MSISSETHEHTIPQSTMDADSSDNPALKELMNEFLVEGKQHDLAGALRELGVDEINCGKGDPLLGKAVSASLGKLLILALIGLGVALVPVMLAFVEGNLVNPDLAPDLIHDCAYFALVVLGLPMGLFFVCNYLGFLPIVMFRLCFAGTVTMSLSELRAFVRWANSLFARKIVVFPPFLAAIIFTGIIVRIFTLGPTNSWHSPDKQPSGTWAGWVQLVPSFLVWYMISFGVMRVVASYVVLSRFFSKSQTNVQPLHPDGCGGLYPLGHLCMRMNVAVFLFGIISLFGVLNNVHYFGMPWFHPANIGILMVYLVSSATIFFLPLYPAHRHMKAAKFHTLQIVSEGFEKVNADLLSGIRKSGRADTRLLSELERLRKVHDIARMMPIYPFNTQIVSSFFGSLAGPLVLPLVVEWLQAWFTK